MNSQSREQVYTRKYYADMYNARREHAARETLRIVLPLVWPIRSAIDVGCGAGVWTKVLLDSGIEKVTGMDGSWMKPEDLLFPRHMWCKIDLEKEEELGMKAEMVMCLEVAEHLKRRAGENLIRMLAEAAPVVLFSAAIPGQKGDRHVNTQWQSYWAGLFKSHGMIAFDVVRHLLWGDAAVPTFYKQNVVVYADPERTDTERLGKAAAAHYLDRMEEDGLKLKIKPLAKKKENNGNGEKRSRTEGPML